MTELEILFIKTIKDIEKRLLEKDPYEILMISGLIRKLLLDDYPLVDQVNEKYREKINFEITIPLSMPLNEPYPIFWTVQDGLDPETAVSIKKRVYVNRDKFFKTIVTIINDQKYSIRDVVMFEANVMGAVHAGTPKNEKEAVLKQIDTNISVGGYASSLRQLKAIARVILKALNPIRKVIESGE